MNGIFKIITKHCKFLVLFNSQDIDTAMRAVSNHPPYSSWKAIVRDQSDDHELLYSLASQYNLNNENNAAAMLRHALVESDALMKYRDAQMIDATTSLLEFMVDVCIERREYDEAFRLYQMVIVEKPEEFWLWHRFCQSHLEKVEIEVAIVWCIEGIKEYPTISSPKLELICLYAARGDYQNAISSFYDFARQCMASGQEDFVRSIMEQLKLTLPFFDPELTSRVRVSHYHQ